MSEDGKSLATKAVRGGVIDRGVDADYLSGLNPLSSVAV